MTKRNTISYATALVLAVVLFEACGRLAAPPQLTPIGDLAYHATRVMSGIALVQQVAIDGEAAGVIATRDARRIVAGTAIAGTAGVDLAGALKAGVSGAAARDKAVRTIRQAFVEVADDLSPEARALIQPYINIVLAAVTLLD